jgi:hypothetical protein
MVLYLISSHPPVSQYWMAWGHGYWIGCKDYLHFFFGGLGYETTFIGALAFTKSNWFSP